MKEEIIYKRRFIIGLLYLSPTCKQIWHLDENMRLVFSKWKNTKFCLMNFLWIFCYLILTIVEFLNLDAYLVLFGNSLLWHDKNRSINFNFLNLIQGWQIYDMCTTENIFEYAREYFRHGTDWSFKSKYNQTSHRYFCTSLFFNLNTTLTAFIY